MQNSEITVLVNGVVQWRFQPHQTLADEVITLRMPQHPPVPNGATLRRGNEPLGTVRCVQRRPFNRWALVFTPATPQPEDPADQTPSGEEGTDISREIPDEANEEDAESISREIIEQPQDLAGLPIAVLAEHLDPRVMGTLEQLAATVEELEAKTDAALRAIDGIGPKRLQEIRAACRAVRGG